LPIHPAGQHAPGHPNHHRLDFQGLHRRILIAAGKLTQQGIAPKIVGIGLASFP